MSGIAWREMSELDVETQGPELQQDWIRGWNIESKRETEWVSTKSQRVQVNKSKKSTVNV